MILTETAAESKPAKRAHRVWLIENGPIVALNRPHQFASNARSALRMTHNNHPKRRLVSINKAKEIIAGITKALANWAA